MNDGRPLAGFEVFAQLCDLFGGVLTGLVKFVLADVNTVEALNELAGGGIVLVVAVHEFGGEGEHVFAERDLSDVGGARSQVFFDSRRQGQRRVLRRGRCGNAGRCQKQNCDSSLHVELSLLLPVTVVSRELNLDLIEGVVGDA
jgi:hypothetical protein